MRSVLLLTALALSGPAGAASDSHQAPAPSLADKPRPLESERHNTLAEMWQRRILPPETDRWGPEEEALLARIRSAEGAGAVSLLRSRAGKLGGLLVTHKPAGGPSRLRLTKAGFDRYLLIRSQEALRYFESKGTDAKWAFALKDLEGRKVFGPEGRLTEAGEAVYNRVLAGQEARWKAPSGEVLGNRPPRRPDGKSP